MKKEEAIKKIESLSPKTFHRMQKDIAIKTLNWANDDEDVSSTYNLLTKSVKTGFVFDEVPESYDGTIRLVKDIPEMQIGGGRSHSIN